MAVSPPTRWKLFLAKHYVNLLLYVAGVKSIETRNIQGFTLMKLTFYQGTNMAQAAAEVTVILPTGAGAFSARVATAVYSAF